jgi:ribose transport system substrate-binding protein
MALAPKQYEGYIVMAIDQTLQGYVNMIADTGADIITLDSGVSDLTKVFANIYDDANAGGIKLADSIAGSIDYKKGNAYQIAVGVTNPEDQVTKTRLAGFNYQLDAKYPGIKVVATAISGSKPGKAATQVAGAFQKNPQLSGFVALDSFTATAAADYVQSNKLDTPLVAYDADPAHVALLKKGVFTHLISQDPAQKMRYAVQLIASHQLTGARPQMRDQLCGNVILDGSSSNADLKKYTYLPGK